MINSRDKNIPWNSNILKPLVNILLIVLMAVDIGMAVTYSNDSTKNIHDVHIYTPVIKLLTFVSNFIDFNYCFT